VRGIARAGRGTAEFVDGLSSKAIEDAVDRQMEVATRPALTKAKIDWGSGAGSLIIGQQTPYKSPPLISGKRLLMYYLVSGTDYSPESIEIASKIIGSSDTTTDLDIKYSVLKESFFDVSSIIAKDSEKQSSLIQKIAARSLIRDLDEGRSELHYNEKWSSEDIEEEIVRLGVKYQIASSKTSFIAVDNQESKDLDVFLDESIAGDKYNDLYAPQSMTHSSILASVSAYIPSSTSEYDGYIYALSKIEEENPDKDCISGKRSITATISFFAFLLFMIILTGYVLMHMKRNKREKKL